MEEIHPLQSKYTFWVQVSGKGKSEAEFSQKIINLCTCESVEDFWECWINTPQPIKCFESNPKPRIDLNRFSGGKSIISEIESIAIFKSPIKPQWEDEANKNGLSVEITIRPDSLIDLQQKWEQITCAMIGETLDNEDLINGIRILDKSRGDNRAFRIDFWFKNGATANSKMYESKIKTYLEIEGSATFQHRIMKP